MLHLAANGIVAQRGCVTSPIRQSQKVTERDTGPSCRTLQTMLFPTFQGASEVRSSRWFRNGALGRIAVQRCKRILHMFCVTEPHRSVARSGGAARRRGSARGGLARRPDVSSGLAFGARGLSTGTEDTGSFRRWAVRLSPKRAAWIRSLLGFRKAQTGTSAAVQPVRAKSGALRLSSRVGSHVKVATWLSVGTCPL